MLANRGNRYNWTFSNYTTPSATPGTSVVPGASNAEGAWTQVATAGNIAYDVELIYIAIGGGNTTANDKSHLLDIGVDPAGGTSYTAVISNIVCGQSQAITTGQCQFVFPLRIKAGSSVAVRVQGSNATAGTVRVVAKFYGRSSEPSERMVGSFSETIGAITNSGGVSVTPGSTAEGAWTSLGTTTNDLWWWQLGMQCSNGTVTVMYLTFDLAYGDATNKVMIIENKHLGFYGTAEIAAWLFDTSMLEGFCYVPGGSNIYIRAHCSTTPVTGFNVTAIGIGG